VKACDTLDGESRLIRTGVPIGKFWALAACRHCDDPECMNSRPASAIKRWPGGEIYFQCDACKGQELRTGRPMTNQPGLWRFRRSSRA